MYYYQHHIGDFKSATSHLDDHQLATYLRMLWTCYDTESPLNGEIEDIAFAMRSDEKTVRLLLRHFFVETPLGWVNQRCEREITEYHSKSDKARNSANARWKNANAMRTHTERNATEPVFDANREPRTENQLDIPASPEKQVEQCDLKSVLTAYHDTLPTLPRVKMIDQKRKAALAARQREYPKAKELDWWHSFFNAASESKFLMGESSGDRSWRADFDFLISPKGFKGVIEGKYQ